MGVPGPAVDEPGARESPHGLGKRIDHEERSEPLTRVQVFRVQPIAASVECCLHDESVPERDPRAFLQFNRSD